MQSGSRPIYCQYLALFPSDQSEANHVSNNATASTCPPTWLVEIVRLVSSNTHEWECHQWGHEDGGGQHFSSPMLKWRLTGERALKDSSNKGIYQRACHKEKHACHMSHEYVATWTKQWQASKAFNKAWELLRRFPLLHCYANAWSQLCYSIGCWCGRLGQQRLGGHTGTTANPWTL